MTLSVDDRRQFATLVLRRMAEEVGRARHVWAGADLSRRPDQHVSRARHVVAWTASAPRPAVWLSVSWR